jgi:hypothetical protein
MNKNVVIVFETTQTFYLRHISWYFKRTRDNLNFLCTFCTEALVYVA